MTDQTKKAPQPALEAEIVNTAKAEEEAGVVDQQSMASAALVPGTERDEAKSPAGSQGEEGERGVN
jgi:hypothetical protein